MTSHQLLAEWSQRFWPVFANHLWQATLFAFVAWIAALWLGQARTRHIVCLMAFAKFLLPSALLLLLAQGAGLNLSWPARTEKTATADAEVLLQIAEPVAQSDAGAGHNEVYCVLTTLWLVGVAACFARWGWRRRRVASIALAGAKVESGREAEMLEDLKSRLNVGRQVGLVVSSSFAEPVVWRALRPVIVLPRGLAERLSDGELESVLKHELFHVKRLDNLSGSLQMFVCCFFWFHPLVRLIDRRLIEERELMCDERVILSGAAPEAYAASLWKVVQFGFGWPVDGVSRATGSNLKRRIKLMLNANHRSKSSTASRALVGITFIALIALAAAMALFSRDRSAVAEATNVQDQDKKFVATAPMQFKNPPEIPLVITEARLSIGEARAITADGVRPGGERVRVMYQEGEMRDAEILLNLVNQSGRRITEFAIHIQNASFWPKRSTAIVSGGQASTDATPGAQVVIEPQGSLAYKTRLLLKEKEGARDLMNHLYDFKVGIVGVKFDFEKDWVWSSEARIESEGEAKIRIIAINPKDGVPGGAPGGVPGGVPGGIPVTPFPPPPPPKRGGVPGGVPGGVVNPKDQDDTVHQMSISLRPTILYREKAQYTREARDNKVEGKIVLSAVFSADGQISDIKVIQGLPDGLTENAIMAAKKIRFEPAMKDGQPVSVRGRLEFTFNLYKDPIQQMDASLRPTITYREKAKYTQEAKDNKVEGTVVLSVVFGADGQIGDIGVIRGLPYGLTQKAIEAISKIRFEPAMKDGHTVSVRGDIEFTFNLY
jgi:TonB family protein